MHSYLLSTETLQSRRTFCVRRRWRSLFWIRSCSELVFSACVCVWCTDNSWGWAGIGDYTVLCHFIIQIHQDEVHNKILSPVRVLKKNGIIVLGTFSSLSFLHDSWWWCCTLWANIWPQTWFVYEVAPHCPAGTTVAPRQVFAIIKKKLENWRM